MPNFAQRLLNQMHYARDQQVIISCLMLMMVFILMAGIILGLWRITRIRSGLLFLLCGMIITVAGCERNTTVPETEVLWSFGRTGNGDGEFLYPRAIDRAADGSIWVVDKSGRIQQFDPRGDCRQVIRMPLIEAGKPVGMSFGPDGNLYVADTHYHRVLIFDPEGHIVGSFGKHGTEDGCFIYPTDVAHGPEGHIYVSEYGGNDRINVFDSEHNFIFSFGTFGNDTGQLSRPSSLAVHTEENRLYVADACNHRVAVYQFDGTLDRYIGSAGKGPGQFRYPYDLVFLQNHELLVCEYGNNRIQLLTPQGESKACFGSNGHEPGKLAYPWGVAVDEKDRAFIVDSGNNRIQVWEL